MNNTMLSQEEKQIVKKAFDKNPDLAEKICNLSVDEITLISRMMEAKTIVNKQYLPNDEEVETIEFILGKDLDFDAFWDASMIYNYGRMQGIRAERARRKTRAC